MARHMIALARGFVLGAVAAAALLFFNPLASKSGLSPVTVSDRDTISLQYPAVAKDSRHFEAIAPTAQTAQSPAPAATASGTAMS